MGEEEASVRRSAVSAYRSGSGLEEERNAEEDENGIRVAVLGICAEQLEIRLAGEAPKYISFRAPLPTNTK